MLKIAPRSICNMMFCISPNTFILTTINPTIDQGLSLDPNKCAI